MNDFFLNHVFKALVLKLYINLSFIILSTQYGK